MCVFFFLFYFSTITLRVFDFVLHLFPQYHFDGTILGPTIKLRSVKSRDIDRSVAVYTLIVVLRFSTAYNIIQRDTISLNFPPLSHPDPATTCRKMPNNTHCFLPVQTVR